MFSNAQFSQKDHCQCGTNPPSYSPQIFSPSSPLSQHMPSALLHPTNTRPPMTSELTNEDIIKTFQSGLSGQLWKTDLAECERRWTHETFLSGDDPDSSNAKLLVCLESGHSGPAAATRLTGSILRDEMSEAIETLPKDKSQTISHRTFLADLQYGHTELGNTDAMESLKTTRRQIVKDLIKALQETHGSTAGTEIAGQDSSVTGQPTDGQSPQKSSASFDQSTEGASAH